MEQVTVNKRSEKDLLQRRHHERRTQHADREEHPGQRAVLAESGVRIPKLRREFNVRFRRGQAGPAQEPVQRRITALEANPHRKHRDAGHERFPAELPFQLRDERAHFPDQPRSNNCFHEVKPEAGCFTEFSLTERQRQENGERHDARH